LRSDLTDEILLSNGYYIMRIKVVDERHDFVAVDMRQGVIPIELQRPRLPRLNLIDDDIIDGHQLAGAV